MRRYFAGHPTAANLMMISILALGIAAMPPIKRETFPDIAPNELAVGVVYPGAGAEDVEEAVCRRIEDAVENVIDIRTMLAQKGLEPLRGLELIAAVGQERPCAHGHDRRDVGPLLDELLSLEHEAVEERALVRAKSREEDLVLRRYEHVDVVDLQEAERLDHAPDLSEAHARGPCALSASGDSPGRAGRAASKSGR